MVQRHDVGSGLVGELDGIGRRGMGRGVASIVDAGRIIVAIDAVFGIGNREVIALGVGHLVYRPAPDRALALRFNPGIGRIAVFHHLSALGPYLEIRRSIAGLSIADHLGKALALGPVFRAIRTIGYRLAIDLHEPLAIQAIAVIAVVVDRASDIVLRHGLRAAANRGQAADAPAHAQQAIAGLAVVAQGQLGRHAGNPGRRLEGNGIGGRAAGIDRKLAWRGHRRLGARLHDECQTGRRQPAGYPLVLHPAPLAVFVCCCLMP